MSLWNALKVATNEKYLKVALKLCMQMYLVTCYLTCTIYRIIIFHLSY